MADKVLYEEMIDFLDAVSAADDNGRKKKKDWPLNVQY